MTYSSGLKRKVTSDTSDDGKSIMNKNLYYKESNRDEVDIKTKQHLGYEESRVSASDLNTSE